MICTFFANILLGRAQLGVRDGGVDGDGGGVVHWGRLVGVTVGVVVVVRVAVVVAHAGPSGRCAGEDGATQHALVDIRASG